MGCGASLDGYDPNLALAPTPPPPLSQVGMSVPSARCCHRLACMYTCIVCSIRSNLACTAGGVSGSHIRSTAAVSVARASFVRPDAVFRSWSVHDEHATVHAASSISISTACGEWRNARMVAEGFRPFDPEVSSPAQCMTRCRSIHFSTRPPFRRPNRRRRVAYRLKLFLRLIFPNLASRLTA